jgi:L-threonylcarbamoyladenylate synthase
MKTECIHIDPLHPEQVLIDHAAALLRAGEVVVLPTETVYGLGADALRTEAVERIFLAKGRPFNDPLIVHIADENMLKTLTTAIPPQVRPLAEAFWPGPLTLIMPRGLRVPRLVTAGLDTVAIRMPRHPVALALIRALDSPVAAPSANRFKHVSPTTAQHAYADLNRRVPLIIDAGPCEVGVESTVLDLCSDIPTILRPGGISLEALQTVLPNVRYSPRHGMEQEAMQRETQAQRSPGQLLTHYAPAIPLILYEGSVEAMRLAMLAEARRRQDAGERVGLLGANEDVPAFAASGALVRSLGAAGAPEQIASSLFAGLRELELAGVQVILCRSFDQSGLGLAVHDRLLRAASERVIV